MIFGGLRAGTESKAAMLVNLDGGEGDRAWRRLPDMPAKHGSKPGCGIAIRANKSAAAIVVVAGGYYKGFSKDKVSILDLRTLAWSKGL